ncbi:accessory Sec-dependent serine-rich glycoprotein adhesin, partial [Streptococcus suis]|uniref:accessory Sec-dependent serine-rich glycoprotein adhesin n=1 Tax=Streptococcus suis TaxID=1307 RepID=UPI003F8CC8CF
MKHKRFNKDFDEVGRKSRVKMHKSGKNWIRTVMSQLSLLRVIRGKGQETVSVPLVDSSERLESQRYQYLKAMLVSGAAVTGAAVMTSVLGEEQVAAVEQQLEETTDTLIDKDHVVVETTTTKVISEESPPLATEQEQNVSVSQSLSSSASESVSLSSSTSASESASTSASESSSTSASVLGSKFTVGSNPESDVKKSASAAAETTISSQVSEESGSTATTTESRSSLITVEDNGKSSFDVLSGNTEVGQGLALLNKVTQKTAATSSEVKTGRIAAILVNQRQQVNPNNLDYANLDNALASLNQALSVPEIDATTTTATRYQRYQTALQNAKSVLAEASALRSSVSVSQDELEAMAKKASQAAISLTGRINQIQAASGMLRAAVGTSTRAVDTTRPVVTYPSQVYFFYNKPLSKDLVLATVTEASNPSTWQRWGIAYTSDSGKHDNFGNLNSMLVDANGSPVTLQIRQKSGTSNQWEMYMPAGSMIAPNNFKGSNLEAREQDYFSRWPFVVDGAWNRNYLGNASGISLTAVAVPSGYINKAFGQTATETELQNIARSWTTSGRFFDGTSPAKTLTYTVQDTPPPTNVTKNVSVLVTTGEGISTTANILVNYPPKIENVASQIFVFNNTATTVATRIATVSDTAGQTVSTTVDDNGGLTVNPSGTVPIGQTFTTGIGRYTRTLRATDNYNNSSTNQFVIRSFNVSGGSLPAEAGTKVTEEAIKNLVKNTATGGEGLTDSGLDNIANYTIVSGYDHAPSVGTKTVRVRATLTGGNYKEVDVTINYTDTQAPTVQLSSQQIYVFNGESVKILNPSSPTATNPVSTKIRLATVTDVTGVATTAASNSDVQGSSGSSNSRGMAVTVEGSSTTSKTVYLSGTASAGASSYGNFLKIADTANPSNTTTYNSTDARYHLVILGTSVATIADRDIQSPTFTRVTEQSILDAVSVDFGNASQYNNANQANIRKVLLSNTGSEATPTAGIKTAVVRVYTSTNTYKDVTVNFNYVDRTVPSIDVTANRAFVFKNESVKVADSNFNQLSGTAGTRLQVGTAADPSGIGAVTIVDTNGTEATRGLTVTTDGSNTSKTIYISGTPTADKNLYTSKVKATDTQNNAGTSQEDLSLYVLEVASEISLADREVTGARYTDTEIVQATINAVQAGNADQKTAAGLTAKVIANPNHTQNRYRPYHTVTVRVKTASGTYKDVRVNFKYVDTTAPTLITNDLYVFNGVALTTPVDVINQKSDTGTGINNLSLRIQESNTGLTVNANEQITGTYRTGAAGLNTRHVQVSDNSTDNNGGPNTTTANLRILVVNPQGASLSKEFTGAVKYTNDEIKQAVLNAMKASGFGNMSEADKTASGLLDISAYSIVNESKHSFTKGSHTVTVRMTNSQGNYADVTVAITYTNAAPVISNQTNLSVIKRSDATPVTVDLSRGATVTDTEDDRSTTDTYVTTVTYKVKGANGAVLKTIQAPKGQSALINVNELTAGTYTVNVEATDSVGTTTTSSFQLTVKDNTPPAITASNRTVDRNDSPTINISVGVSVTDTEDAAAGVRPSVTYKVVHKNGKVVY